MTKLKHDHLLLARCTRLRIATPKTPHSLAGSAALITTFHPALNNLTATDTCGLPLRDRWWLWKCPPFAVINRAFSSRLYRCLTMLVSVTRASPLRSRERRLPEQAAAIACVPGFGQEDEGGAVGLV